MTTTVLTRQQTKTYGPKVYTQDGTTYMLTVTVRYDDQCGNGHNSFAITSAQYRKADNGKWEEDCFGRCHDLIAERFPDLAPFIKWHGMTSEGPCYYVENTVYHALEHGPKYAWIYYTGPQDPLQIEEKKERLLGYEKADVAKRVEGQPGYRVKWDDKTSKTRNLDYARSTAVWPEATDEELTAPGLEDRLRARLPQLMTEFQEDLKKLGLVY